MALYSNAFDMYRRVFWFFGTLDLHGPHGLGWVRGALNDNVCHGACAGLALSSALNLLAELSSGAVGEEAAAYGVSAAVSADAVAFTDDAAHGRCVPAEQVETAVGVIKVTSGLCGPTRGAQAP